MIKSLDIIVSHLAQLCCVMSIVSEDELCICCVGQYTLRCDMRRSLLAKDLSKTCEFMVHSQVSVSHIQIYQILIQQKLSMKET